VHQSVRGPQQRAQHGHQQPAVGGCLVAGAGRHFGHVTVGLRADVRVPQAVARPVVGQQRHPEKAAPTSAHRQRTRRTVSATASTASLRRPVSRAQRA